MRIRIGRLNERGASAAIMAVALFAMLGMGALAVDVGMLLKVRADAQRSADASALAGAAEYYGGNSLLIRDQAADSAWTYAGRNYVGWQPIDTSGRILTTEGTVRVVNTPEAVIYSIPDSHKVRVVIRRAGTATWFGNLLGLDFVPVSGRAAARVIQAGSAKCVKPFAIPDLWDETSAAQDVNNNMVWDTGEGWEYNPPSDTYAPFDPDGNNLASQTGYGSAWRNNNGDNVTGDYGRVITIKAQRPNEAITSGFFYPWRMPLADGDTAAGANEYKALITDTTCTLAGPTIVDTTYRVENGNMVGPTRQAIQELMSYDPGAYWDPNAPDGEGHTGAIRGSKYSHWRDSPRVIVLGIMKPEYIANIRGGGGLNFEFNNLAMFFVEGFDPNWTGPTPQAPIKGRFLYFVKGHGVGPVAGSLIKKLQLVE